MFTNFYLFLLSKFTAQNNFHTRHLAKILIHLAWCLQECVTSSGVASAALVKSLNALYISSVFLKYVIENARSDNFEELHLSIDKSEPLPGTFSTGDVLILLMPLFPYFFPPGVCFYLCIFAILKQIKAFSTWSCIVY